MADVDRDEPDPAQGRPRRDRYLVKSLVRATEVLWAFQHPGESLRLRDVMARTRFGKGLCFRLLHTLHHCGFLERVEGNRYHLTVEIRRRRRYRIGYAAQGQDSSFPREVRAGLVRAAERENVELIVVDNRYQPRIALRNAECLIREGVDLVIEFQTDEAVAPPIASRYLEAGIPMIAIDIPHPGATYFGANNYEAGLLAGRHLGRWARQHWAGQVDEIVLLKLARAGSLPRARMRGVMAGIKEVMHEAAECPCVALDGDGQFKTSLERARSGPRLPGGGPLRLLREPRTPLVASVGYFPERYGDGLLRLALDILARKPVAPAVFVKHQTITPENVDHFYPNDALLAGESAARF